MGELEGMVPEGVRALKAAMHTAETSLGSIGDELWELLRGAWISPVPANNIRQVAAWAGQQGPEINRRLLLLERMELDKPELFGGGKPVMVDEALFAPGAVLPVTGGFWDRLGQQVQATFDPNLNSGDPVIELAKGTVEGAVGAGQTVLQMTPNRMIFDYWGWERDAGDVAQAVVAGVQDPLGFAKAAVDWDTWASNPERAFGRLVPDILAALGSGGSSAVASGGKRVAGALAKAAESTGKGTRLSDNLGARPPSPGSGAGPAGSPGVRYGPSNPGPLAGQPDLISTFRSGSYSVVTTTKPTTLYRVYGGTAGELGTYWTTAKPTGPVQSILDSALFTQWGNTATKWVEIRVPPGTTYYEGIAAEQGGLAGGGAQVVIPKRVDPSWIVDRGEFPMRNDD